MITQKTSVNYGGGYNDPFTDYIKLEIENYYLNILEKNENIPFNNADYIEYHYMTLVEEKDYILESDKIQKLRELSLKLIDIDNNENNIEKSKIEEEISEIENKTLLLEGDIPELKVNIEKKVIKKRVLDFNIGYYDVSAENMVKDYISQSVINLIRNEIDNLSSKLIIRDIKNFNDLKKYQMMFHRKYRSYRLYGDEFINKFDFIRNLSEVEFNDNNKYIITTAEKPLVLYIQNISIINDTMTRRLVVEYYLDLIDSKSSEIFDLTNFQMSSQL